MAENNILYVRSENGEALYLNGYLYDENKELNIYDLLGMLELKGIVKSARVHVVPPKKVERYNFPINFKDIN